MSNTISAIETFKKTITSNFKKSETTLLELYGGSWEDFDRCPTIMQSWFTFMFLILHDKDQLVVRFSGIDLPAEENPSYKYPRFVGTRKSTKQLNLFSAQMKFFFSNFKLYGCDLAQDQLSIHRNFSNKTSGKACDAFAGVTGGRGNSEFRKSILKFIPCKVIEEDIVVGPCALFTESDLVQAGLTALVGSKDIRTELSLWSGYSVYQEKMLLNEAVVSPLIHSAKSGDERKGGRKALIMRKMSTTTKSSVGAGQDGIQAGIENDGTSAKTRMDGTVAITASKVFGHRKRDKEGAADEEVGGRKEENNEENKEAKGEEEDEVEEEEEEEEGGGGGEDEEAGKGGVDEIDADKKKKIEDDGEEEEEEEEEQEEQEEEVDDKDGNDDMEEVVEEEVDDKNGDDDMEEVGQGGIGHVNVDRKRKFYNISIALRAKASRFHGGFN